HLGAGGALLLPEPLHQAELLYDLDGRLAVLRAVAHTRHHRAESKNRLMAEHHPPMVRGYIGDLPVVGKFAFSGDQGTAKPVRPVYGLFADVKLRDSISRSGSAVDSIADLHADRPIQQVLGGTLLPSAQKAAVRR